MATVSVIPGALHGACTRTTAVEHLGRYQVRTLVRQGRLAALWPGILVDQDRLADPKTRAASAILSAGEDAVLADQTALYLHGCTAAASVPVHVQVPYNRWPARRSGVVLHHGRVDPRDRVEVAGLPVQALHCAAAAVLCRGPRRTALACCDQILAPLSDAARADIKQSIAARLDLRADRRGTVQAQRLLSLATGLPESPAESSVFLVVVDRGFPPPVAQHKVCAPDGRELYRLDFAWVELGIALEYDGYAAHQGREAQDAAREEDLRRRGWTVVRASAGDLSDPTRLWAALAAAFQCRSM